VHGGGTISPQGIACRTHRLQGLVVKSFAKIGQVSDCYEQCQQRSYYSATGERWFNLLEISTGKIVRVIMLSREYGPGSRRLVNYVSAMNDDEKVNLVAVTWIGRESFAPDELEEAKQAALREATVPTETYLSGIPSLAEHLENGMDALGIDVTDAEEHI
jgi:hypothetical protein